MIGPGTRRALSILREHGPMTAGEFAREMWPDSPAWKRVYNCGPNGATRGRGLVKSGGSFLGKLAKQELVEVGWDRHSTVNLHSLSQHGRYVLREDEERVFGSPVKAGLVEAE